MFSARFRAFYTPTSPRLYTQSSPYPFSLKRLGGTRHISNFGRRSPKSASEWTAKDLKLWNITLNEVDHLEFFGRSELPQLPEKLLRIVDIGNEKKKRKGQNEFVRLLNLANVPDAHEHDVDTFAAKVLHVMGFCGRNRKIVQKMDLNLYVCAEPCHAIPDISIRDRRQTRSILLLGGEDKPLKNRQGAPKHMAQVVAEGVAIFNQNNVYREASGLPPLTKALIPAFIMTGTSPTFLKIPVTEDLLTHIRHGTYPPEETRVTYCHAPVPPKRRKMGMQNHDDRLVILRCFEAFKVVVGI